jgi:hypothetical protein
MRKWRSGCGGRRRHARLRPRRRTFDRSTRAFEHLSRGPEAWCACCVAKLRRRAACLPNCGRFTVDWREPSLLRLEGARSCYGQLVTKLPVTSSRAPQLTMFTLMFDRTDAEGWCTGARSTTLRATAATSWSCQARPGGAVAGGPLRRTDLSPFDDDSDTIPLPSWRSLIAHSTGRHGWRPRTGRDRGRCASCPNELGIG